MRYLRAFLAPARYVAITLVQPMIWLLLFGALFKRVVEIPGFDAADYVDFLTPGVVVMTALFSAGWSGMALHRRHRAAASWTASSSRRCGAAR